MDAKLIRSKIRRLLVHWRRLSFHSLRMMAHRAFDIPISMAHEAILRMEEDNEVAIVGGVVQLPW